MQGPIPFSQYQRNIDCQLRLSVIHVWKAKHFSVALDILKSSIFELH